jgi:hypothetical protein
LKVRCNILGISFEKNTFFAIDRSDKQSIYFRDIEYEVKEFAEEYNGKVLILDMLKDISFDIGYDINSYQDIAQKLMSQIRNYADKYNLTILFVHHLNKLGKTLGSTEFDAIVDGIIRLSKNSFDYNTIKMEIINRDFPDEEEYLHKDKNQVFSIAKDNALEIANPVIVAFVKYAIREKKFDFTIGEIINKANLMCTLTQLCKLLNTQKDLLEQEDLHISKYRTTKGRMYHIDYEESSLENE